MAAKPELVRTTATYDKKQSSNMHFQLNFEKGKGKTVCISIRSDHPRACAYESSDRAQTGARDPMLLLNFSKFSVL